MMPPEITWLWYRATHPSRGEKAHAFVEGADRSVCTLAFRSRTLGAPLTDRRCKLCGDHLTGRRTTPMLSWQPRMRQEAP